MWTLLKEEQYNPLNTTAFLWRQQALSPRGPVFILASPESRLAVMQRDGCEDTWAQPVVFNWNQQASGPLLPFFW